jgi:hypothetical protein
LIVFTRTEITAVGGAVSVGVHIVVVAHADITSVGNAIGIGVDVVVESRTRLERVVRLT